MAHGIMFIIAAICFGAFVDSNYKHAGVGAAFMCNLLLGISVMLSQFVK